MENGSLQEITDLLLKSDNIILSAHIGPDGDAISSISALLLALKKLGKNVSAVLGAFPDKFYGIPGAEFIATELPDDIEADLFVALDSADIGRLGKNVKYMTRAKRSVNIDHHKSNTNFADYNYVLGTAAATAEIIYTMLAQSSEFTIDEDIASALFTGILYDSGGFRHPSCGSYTYLVASRLIDLGANHTEIFKKFFYTMKFEEAQILAIALDKIKLEYDGELAWTSITTEELVQTGARLGELDNIVNYCLNIKGVKIAAFYYQKAENEFKVSLRSEEDYDVSDIAQKFGGGGHKNAAGTSLFTTLEDAITAINGEIGRRLHQPDGPCN